MRSFPRVRPRRLSALLLTCAACGTSDLLGPDPPQGIDAIVLLGPQCPVESLENPCPEVTVNFDTGIR